MEVSELCKTKLISVANHVLNNLYENIRWQRDLKIEDYSLYMSHKKDLSQTGTTHVHLGPFSHHSCPLVGD